jgi:hypothetical protein
MVRYTLEGGARNTTEWRNMGARREGSSRYQLGSRKLQVADLESSTGAKMRCQSSIINSSESIARERVGDFVYYYNVISLFENTGFPNLLSQQFSRISRPIRSIGGETVVHSSVR